ncbi:hypothetical protein COT57_03765 [Candidatus Micrarchaeota archaeon CG09_land_8_20_14_0_10_55_25]|nr:MAG: hypothetical protein COT57_03765 [Candidatus Micrarchaeota archaeon CG09_land_8_20_14_0_10_55_25]
MRGQTDAPIALFVAVIILAVSMGLAFSLMNQTNESKCIAQLKTETEKLQSAMLDVALASPPTSRTITFEMPRCGDISIEVMQIVYYSEPEYCRLCPAHYGGCWQIVPISVDKEGKYSIVSDATSCIQMAGQIHLTNENCEQGWNALSLNDEPCPESEPDCRSASGISENVWSGREDDPSRWLTLGRDSSTRIYKIRLTKGTTLRGGKELGLIKVCVKPANA